MHKIRKSEPDVTIGTCTVLYGNREIVICPNRLLERGQVFLDCLHLLTLHEPGNELHIVAEVFIPGGSIDYFLVSTRNNKVRDFVALELQALDTTGTVWPARQRFLQSKGIPVEEDRVVSGKGYGMNWKMTTKTTLVQLNHKIRTLENVHKHLVLVIQDHLLDYMKREFQFGHLSSALVGDSMHFHSYSLAEMPDSSFRLELGSRLSTDADGIATSLGLRADPHLALEEIERRLEQRISPRTLFQLPG